MKSKVDRNRLRGLTIQQPFASRIADGEKWVENRKWNTRYRGQLLIHAGLGLDWMQPEYDSLPRGHILATADLVACVSWEEASDRCLRGEGHFTIGEGLTKTYEDLIEHRHSSGPFCWVFENVVAVKPILFKGSQGIWSASPEDIPLVPLETPPKSEIEEGHSEDLVRFEANFG